MTPTTPMALDEVLAELPEQKNVVCDGCAWHVASAYTVEQMHDYARATIAALQSAHAEEVAGLREELAGWRNLLAATVASGLLPASRTLWPFSGPQEPATVAFALHSAKMRAEQAEARLARVEALPAQWLTAADGTRGFRQEHDADSAYDSALDSCAAALAAAVAPVGVGE